MPPSDISPSHPVPAIERTIAARVGAAARIAFAELAAARGEGGPADLDPRLRPATRPEFGHFQTSLPLRLARPLGLTPHEAGSRLLAALDVDDLCEQPVLAGAGFINLTLWADALAAPLTEVLADPRPASRWPPPRNGSSSTYSVAERRQGDARRTRPQHRHRRQPRARPRGRSATRSSGRTTSATGARPSACSSSILLDLGEEAALATSITDLMHSTSRRAPSSTRTRRSPSGRASASSCSRAATSRRSRSGSASPTPRSATSAPSTRSSASTLKDEHVARRELLQPDAPRHRRGAREEGPHRGRATARCAAPSPEGFTNKEGARLPLIVRKQDGGYGYAATDLAALRSRTQDLGADAPPLRRRRAAAAALRDGLRGREGRRLAAEPARAEHVAFGSILGPDKKMFKTRAGGTVKLAELLDEAVQRAAAAVAEKNPELDEATRAAGSPARSASAP